ncbi:MAG TPA: hypothetical protein VNI61_12255 [Gemmatimonadales bacterium]|nr:hypothetical protein [Gemmatimonadales bacterium]
MRKFRYVAVMLAAAGVVACEDPLDVKNVNNPNTDDVLATPADLQNWIRDTYNAWFRGNYFDNLRPQMFTSALENHSELANFNMGPRYLMPRNFIENSRGAAGTGESNADFVQFHRAARSAALGLQKLRTITLGSPGLDAQARAFAWFALGLSNGYLSMVWDSAAVASPDDDPACVSLDCLPQLVGYRQVNAAALANLDSAEAVALAAPSGAFPIPAAWLRQDAGVSQASFLRLVRSYRAQIRAGVARTPAERAAVDWTRVIADAEAGITANFQINADPANNWTISWPVNNFRAGSWHGMHQFMIGMADTSGEYERWLNTPRASKVQFLIQTPDRRFPVGATRTAQQSGTAVLPPGQYFRNRPPGDDTPGDGLGSSMYDHYRFRAFFNANRIGPYPILTKAEIDLLAAEGYIRTGDLERARAKINLTRAASGLDTIPAGVALTDPVPGGTRCVPRVPVWTGTAYQAVCGNIWEALKWEKRMETAYTGYGNWFIDSRGWGDLPEGTALDWPVPWQEKDTRRLSFVTVWGGCSRLSTGESAGPSTYGPAISCNPTP